MGRVERYDQTEPVGEVTTTPTGGRRIAANLSRVGVFAYQHGDGTVVREYRPPEEVLAPEAVASFRGAPVTWLHPEGGVSPANFRAESRGVVYATSAEAPFMTGALDINDAELIARVDADEAREVSCGYTADCDPTPGVTADGEKYDAVQRNIRANHVAVGPRGWGRQGPTVALRLDSGSAIGIAVADATASQERGRTMKTVKVDGIDYEAGSDSHLSAIAKFEASLVKRAEDAEKSAAAEKARADAAAATVKAAEDKAATEKKRADDAEAKADAKAIAARVNERVRLITIARSPRACGPTYLADADAMAAASDDDIILAALQKMSPGFDPKGLDHAGLMGALAFACASAAGDDSAEDEIATGDSQTPGGQPVGGLDDMDPNAMKPSAFDAKNAPRGRIGESVQNPNFPESDPDEKTQSQALREQQKRRADSWKQPLRGASLAPSLKSR